MVIPGWKTRFSSKWYRRVLKQFCGQLHSCLQNLFRSVLFDYLFCFSNVCGWGKKFLQSLNQAPLSRVICLSAVTLPMGFHSNGASCEIVCDCDLQLSATPSAYIIYVHLLLLYLYIIIVCFSPLSAYSTCIWGDISQMPWVLFKSSFILWQVFVYVELIISPIGRCSCNIPAIFFYIFVPILYVRIYKSMWFLSFFLCYKGDWTRVNVLYMVGEVLMLFAFLILNCMHIDRHSLCLSSYPSAPTYSLIRTCLPSSKTVLPIALLPHGVSRGTDHSRISG